MTAVVTTVFAGPKTADWAGRGWDRPVPPSGIRKHPITGDVDVDHLGIPGDEQADVHHGGRDKALCVYPTSNYVHWAQILGRNDLEPGAFGENLAVDGATEDDVCIGDTYRVGTAVVQVSQPRSPCWKLTARWAIPAIDVQDRGLTGWYLRVLQPGRLRAGDPMELLDRPHEDWTVRAIHHLRHTSTPSPTRRAVAACQHLPPRWRDAIRHPVTERSRERLDGPAANPT
jgi:MOSC domain-containing protein YiiM